MRSALSALLRSTRTVQCEDGSAIKRKRCSTVANRLLPGQASTSREQHASSWTLRFGSNRDGRLSSLSTNPALRRVVKESSEDDKVHHRENGPQLWETASHPLETHAHDVPPRWLRSLSAEGKFGKTEVSALTSTPGSFIRTVESSSRELHTC
ncbi:hypothetical protein TcCL_NonESM09938 [Trypanosoma cruzi]|nr:hypothetical protein TcCL_NonESM09938 [Trypanosoma cruzi]